nr:ethanolamine ammonia-lyase subunit EutC [Nakamurella flavida]
MVEVLEEAERTGADPAPEDRAAGDFWALLRPTTQSRIGLGRAGDSLSTRHVLELKAAHASARDAVHDPLPVAEFAARVGDVGLGAPVVVTSRARDRGEYLRRPDLGREPAELDEILGGEADLVVVLADGLSPRALVDHGAELLAALVAEFDGRWTLAPPVIATQARVALGDHIAAASGASTVLVLIGERPGLSVADSLGIYLTHRPQPGRTADSDRNCISNIHPPDGLSYAQAARVCASLVDGARSSGRSGVTLKDTSRTALGAAGAAAALD